MSTAVGTDPVEGFIKQLRERYGVVNGIRVVPDNFAHSLEYLTKWAVVTLDKIPGHPGAIKTLEAIREYRAYIAANY